MTDSFKDQLKNIASAAKERLEREKKEQTARDKRFRKDVKKAFAAADSFNKRVIVPLLAEFSAGAPGAGKFACEFNKSDSQPEFVHACKVQDQRLTVSLLYWIAGSARLSCSLGYSNDPDSMKIESFEEADLDNRVREWLEKQLLEKYAAYMERVHTLGPEWV